MQTIIFYLNAKETLGVVRDKANAKNVKPPTLMLGVSVQLNARLYADGNSTSAYPISLIQSLTWTFVVDSDFDRTSSPKIIVNSGITVSTVTENQQSYTQVNIPISDMSSSSLINYLDKSPYKDDLVGELVGYDNQSNAVFVIQIENISVRNRIQMQQNQ